jgi:multiple sugar transport system substrate-binding protein
MKLSRKLLKLLTIFAILAAFMVTTVGSTSVTAQDTTVTFMSTQFNTVEESEVARDILAGFEGGEVEFIGQEESPMIDLLIAEADAGEGTVDVIGALHGTFPTLRDERLVFDLSDLLTELDPDGDRIAPAFVELGKLGTADFQFYIPWMQATYIMAANVEALEYLPEGADLNALTWEELGQWGANISEATGEQKLGFPVDGLMHRFLQGYLYPSFTGGMVTGYKSEDAVAMYEFFVNDIWPYTNPQSRTYSFMNEPLLTGEVWVAFDHTARLLPAFDEDPEGFVAFPAPAGPMGRGFMPVIVGLGIPETAPDPDAAADLIEFMLSVETQEAVLNQLGFFPVVAGVDFSELPAGVAAEADAVTAQATSEDALPALLPVGLGDRGNEFNQVYRDTFGRIVLEGEDTATVLEEEAANLQEILDDTGAPCWPPDAPSEGACQVE